MNPHVVLEIYPEGLFLTKQDGLQTSRYPVSADDVVSALSNRPISTGFLPRDTLFWQHQGGHERLAIFVPGQTWEVKTDEGGYRIPFPPLVFMGAQRTYSVFALKKRPSMQTIQSVQLYHFPGSNVNAKGLICNGNVPFPVASSETIEGALMLFMESGFNHDNSQERCRGYESSIHLWRTLDGAETFPLDVLLPARMRLVDLRIV